MAEEYSGRAYDAVQRVLIDLAQVLASFEEELVIVGGLVPSLLFPQGQPPHERFTGRGLPAALHALKNYESHITSW